MMTTAVPAISVIVPVYNVEAYLQHGFTIERGPAADPATRAARITDLTAKTAHA